VAIRACSIVPKLTIMSRIFLPEMPAVVAATQPKRLYASTAREVFQSRRQGARSWELRTAVDLAALWAAQEQRERAQALLEPIFEAFVEGSIRQI
jgi:hypothetical protein